MAYSSSFLSIDLHIHSTASDGSLSPGEILLRASAAGLYALAITDHDTLDGVREVMAGGIPDSPCFVTGVEISSAPHPDIPCRGSLHILGYGIDVTHQGLSDQLSSLQQARAGRNPAIIEKLNRMGIAVTIEEVEAVAKGGQAGRPHVADVLVRKGLVRDIDEAFNRYLGVGKPAYVDKYRVPFKEAVSLIHSAGGVAVLAHPGLVHPLGSMPVEGLIGRLAEEGLDGLEVYYPEHDAGRTMEFERLADRLGLLMTGGTDFHGELKPSIEIGYGDGGFSVPDRCFHDLVSRLNRDTDADPRSTARLKTRRA
ncbi:MAG: PHP domain-containing protein [Desulfobacterales bacterium]